MLLDGRLRLEASRRLGEMLCAQYRWWKEERGTGVGRKLLLAPLRKAIRITCPSAKRQTQNAKHKNSPTWPHAPSIIFLVIIAYNYRAFLTNNSGPIFLDSRLSTLDSRLLTLTTLNSHDSRPLILDLLNLIFFLKKKVK
jgi:hypothetical protein